MATSPWEALSPLPVGVAGAAVLARNDALDVAGGTVWRGEEKLTRRERWIWTAASGRWTRGADLPYPFAHGVHGRRGDRLMLAGGSDGERTRRDVIELEPDGREQSLATLPEPMVYGGGVVRENTLLLLGGSSDINDLGRLSADFVTVDLTTRKTAALPSYPGGPVMHPRLALAGRQVLVFPGGRYDATQRRPVNLAAVWAYDLPSRRWNRRADYPFPVRGIAVCALEGGRLIFTAGGYRSANGGAMAMTAECFLYEVATDRYRVLPPLPYAAMLMEAACDGEWLYVVGGEDKSRHRASDAWRARISDVIAAAQK